MPISIRRISPLLVLLALLAPSAAPAQLAPGTPEQQTMDRLRAIAGALLFRESDETSGENRLEGPAAGWILTSEPPSLIRMPPAKELRSYPAVLMLLRPSEDFIYLCDVPERDAWGERIEVYYEEERILAGRAVTVRSSGANRRFDSDAYEVGGFLPGAATDDIVFAGEEFVRWPLGVPKSELKVKEKIGRCPGFDDGSGGEPGEEAEERDDVHGDPSRGSSTDVKPPVDAVPTPTPPPANADVGAGTAASRPQCVPKGTLGWAPENPRGALA